MRKKLLPYLIVRAKDSAFWLTLLNFLLVRLIPFNRPHKFRIKQIDEERILVHAPYRRSNHNHIRGIHACALATAAEFSAGFLLLSRLDAGKYRLIMAKLQAEYFYQAKKDSIAITRLSNERMMVEVIEPLRHNAAVMIEMKTDVRDVSGNTVAEVCTEWQVKRWEEVRTRV